MKGNCPITGARSAVSQASATMAVDHPNLGRYLVDVAVLPELEADERLRERLAQWITESGSLGIEIPNLTTEYVDLVGRLGDLEEAISDWVKRRETIAGDDHERLWKKLRLEWNYNTNHIEGNTLTYHETELLLIHGRTAGGHPMRDYEEMKAHDVAIDHARQLAEEERILGEGDIRDLNKILLKEPFWHVAETSDGQRTRKRIEPGVYKIQPNHVRTPTGELHRFAEPEETPALMEQWTADFRRNLERNAYPLPLFLAESHQTFLRIHPFGDGNGRTARLIANYVLLRRGLPPMVIKSAERDRYIGALQNADLGHIEPLARFMLDNVLWSLDLAIRAAKGESIDEPGDLNKEIALFVRRKRGGAPKKSDIEILDDVFHRWIRPTLDRVESALEPVRELFRTEHPYSLSGLAGRPETNYPGVLFTSGRWEQDKQTYIVKPGFELTDHQPIELVRGFVLKNYTGRGARAFDTRLSLSWKLHGKVATLEVEIDGKPVAEAASRVRYAELEELDVERTAGIICKALIAEISRRSQDRD